MNYRVIVLNSDRTRAWFKSFRYYSDAIDYETYVKDILHRDAFTVKV